MECFLCQNTLPEVGNTTYFCEKCDLYHVDGCTWNSMDEFLNFLNGKKFIYCSSVFERRDNQLSNLQGFADAMITSLYVSQVDLSCFPTPEDLISVVALMEKLPNCRNVFLKEFTITASTAPYLAKLMSLKFLSEGSRIPILDKVTFTPDACEAWAASLDPKLPVYLPVLRQCTLPNATPIFNALLNKQIQYNELTNDFLGRHFTGDEECNAFINIIKHNKHLKQIGLVALSGKMLQGVIESIRYSDTIELVGFSRCDLTTAMPIITESLGYREKPFKLSFSSCNITLEQLKDLCNGIKKQNVLSLVINEREYNNSLEPVVALLEDTTSLTNLLLIVSSSAQDYVPLFKALKKNTTLTDVSISIASIDQNDQIVIELLANALAVNNTIRSLHISILRRCSPILDQLVTVAVSQNKLESFCITHGQLKDLSFATLCDMLKKNRTLHRIELGSELQRDTSDEKVQLFHELMEQNYFLLKCNIVRFAHQLIKPYKERNEEYQKEWSELNQNMVVLLHNMARNAETIRKLLPIEMWLEVFKRITHHVSPDNGLENMAKDICAQYKLL